MVGVLSQTHASTRLFHTQHTDWLMCSLTHLVNCHVSHFKSCVYNDVFNIYHSCLRGSSVKGQGWKLWCLFRQHLCRQIPVTMPQAERFTTPWQTDLWLLCFAASLYAFFGVCWSVNTLFEELFIVTKLLVCEGMEVVGICLFVKYVSVRKAQVNYTGKQVRMLYGNNETHRWL